MTDDEIMDMVEQVDFSRPETKLMQIFYETGRLEDMDREAVYRALSAIDIYLRAIHFAARLTVNTERIKKRKRTCPLCGEKYKRLKTHMRAHENNPNEYPVLEERESE